jgi:hypothetical protein
MFLTISLWYGLGVFSNGNVDFIKKDESPRCYELEYEDVYLCG